MDFRLVITINLSKVIIFLHIAQSIRRLKIIFKFCMKSCALEGMVFTRAGNRLNLRRRQSQKVWRL